MNVENMRRITSAAQDLSGHALPIIMATRPPRTASIVPPIMAGFFLGIAISAAAAAFFTL
jgi:hypothetical protein